MLTEIMTVTGPVFPEDLGVTLMHEHLIINREWVTRNANQILSDPELARREMMSFKLAGGGTIVELTNDDIGRSPNVLRDLSRDTGIHIVMGCGWYCEPYYSPSIKHTSTNALADEIINEALSGVLDSGVRPGIIGEIGVDRSYISPSEERCLRASARAHLHTDLTVSTHAVGFPVGADQLDMLIEEGVMPNRVIVGHCDSYPHADYHQRLAERGAWVQFDLIRGSMVEYELNSRIGLVLEAKRRGFLGRLLLSQDVCGKSHLRAYGGKGYDYLLTSFLPRLEQAGITADELRQLTVENPRRALTGAA